MNPFAMRKENNAFVGIALTLERFMTAMENGTLKKDLKEAVALIPEEIEKSKTALAYIESAGSLRAEIETLAKSAQDRHDKATALLNEAQATAEKTARYAAAEDKRLEVVKKAAADREGDLNARHAQLEAKHAQLSARENELNARANTLETTHSQKASSLADREGQLAKDRAEFEDGKQKTRQRAAAALAALRE